MEICQTICRTHVNILQSTIFITFIMIFVTQQLFSVRNPSPSQDSKFVQQENNPLRVIVIVFMWRLGFHILEVLSNLVHDLCDRWKCWAYKLENYANWMANFTSAEYTTTVYDLAFYDKFSYIVPNILNAYIFSHAILSNS